MASCTLKNSAFLHFITLIIQLLYTAVFISELLGGKLPPNFLRFPLERCDRLHLKYQISPSKLAAPQYCYPRINTDILIHDVYVKL